LRGAVSSSVIEDPPELANKREKLFAKTISKVKQLAIDYYKEEVEKYKKQAEGEEEGHEDKIIKKGGGGQMFASPIFLKNEELHNRTEFDNEVLTDETKKMGSYMRDSDGFKLKMAI